MVEVTPVAGDLTACKSFSFTSLMGDWKLGIVCFWLTHVGAAREDAECIMKINIFL
jgi:hypothetical protein